MSAKLLFLLAVMVAFGALTTKAMLDSGIQGILAVPLSSWAGAQVFTDLVIVGLMACVWMVKDAPLRGLRAWPFVLLTLATGSFGPLTYLVVREWRSTQSSL